MGKLTACLVFLALFVAPMADDILGSTQYKQLCEATDRLKILGTINVRESTGLHSVNGDWLLAKLEPSEHAERERLNRIAQGLVRWTIGGYRPISGLSTVTERTDKVYEASSERLLAEITSYHYRGGFLRRNLLDSSSQCLPEGLGGLYPKLLTLQGP